MCVLYGDYPPRSILTTQVAYIGSEYNAMASKLKDQIFLMQSFTGGSIIHNAIHEGLAAGLQVF